MSQKSIDLGLGVRNVKEKSSEYIVEKFLGKRYLRGRPQYLTKWEGYPIEQCTWEPLENLGKCMTLIGPIAWLPMPCLIIGKRICSSFIMWLESSSCSMVRYFVSPFGTLGLSA
uniref:IP03643p n=1 Tax=Drosophila melanogaster TaxID=7227 RepID=Q4V490_DROME|nr:IP03643p [Drosophila melanogaster]